MELLLNLAWLLLALPAYWLWRGRNHAHARTPSPLQFLLTLACMLVILFPVISATDDLCAMRAEFEESAPSKHALRQATHDRLSASKWQTHPALPAGQKLPYASEQARLNQLNANPFPQPAHANLLPARAPPIG